VTIVEFLNARLDEDQQAIHPNPSYCEACTVAWIGHQGRPHYRPLADIAAKRAIIAVEMDRVGVRREFVSVEVADRVRGRTESPVLFALAAVYSDHPDYDRDWVSPQVSTPRG
jgi:uncharacterized protein DUF6221